MGRVRIALAVAAAAAMVVLTACSGPAAPAGHHQVASYYLALGDSLSQGVQPDAAGASVETGQGYPSQVYTTLRRGRPGLRLVKLGCPGETTSTMINGGICRYSGGSQLAAAVAFLHAHRGHVLLVTIDIGANDPADCAKLSLTAIISCVGTDIGTDLPRALTNLTTIMARLRAATGPGVRIVGMSYYLPELAEWRHGLFGQLVARITERLAASYSTSLGRVYAKYGARVADVFGAFATADFGNQVTVPGIGAVPRNVARVCQWTWECAASPRGPNQHANDTGYGVIARAFLSAAGFG
jgi:lysophospholipase L1-like esterase